jgi:predicted enzyme related to lactoylglutathione lyase
MTSSTGQVTWRDLTVEDAERIRDFYSAVVGWDVEEVDMDGYHDFAMKSSDGDPVAGVCHARGVNAGMPPQWLIYITVADLQESIRQCEALGGRVIAAPRELAGGSFCVIQDPAGAVAALYMQ